MTKSNKLPECPVETTLMLIGSKWKLLIMRNLLVRPWRFNELQKSLVGISQKAVSYTHLGKGSWKFFRKRNQQQTYGKKRNNLLCFVL